MKRSYEFLNDALEEAAEHGDVRRDVPPQMLATIVLGTNLARALLAAVLDEGNAALSSPPDGGWDYLVSLLRPPAEEASSPAAASSKE